MEELKKIQLNWNTSFMDKGDKCYELAKTLEFGSRQQKECLEAAVYYYENSKTESILCNQAHSYFLLARIFGIHSEEYYRRSIEYHIKGSKSKKYQYEDFYKFYDVNDNNIDSILKTIRLVKPSTFNDPTDCSISQKGLNTFLFPDKDKVVFDGLRVCCFGRIKGKYRAWEDSKKWAYYGNASNGICIRYRFFNRIIEDMLADKFVFKEVKYKDNFEFYNGIVADGLFTKSKDYSEENEWRIVFYDRDIISNQYYKDGSIYLPIGRQYFYQIFIGYRCKDSIVNTILDHANNGDNKISVLKIHPANDNVFKLIGTQIN